MNTTFKGITIQQLGTIAVFFVIAAITISIGAQVLTDLAEQQCLDHVNGTWTGIFENSSTGCCLDYNATNGTCLGGVSPSAAFNVSDKGIEGVATLGDWLPLIGLVIAAAVVIGILIRYLGGVVGGA